MGRQTGYNQMNHQQIIIEEDREDEEEFDLSTAEMLAKSTVSFSKMKDYEEEWKKLHTRHISEKELKEEGEKPLPLILVQ